MNKFLLILSLVFAWCLVAAPQAQARPAGRHHHRHHHRHHRHHHHRHHHW